MSDRITIVVVDDSALFRIFIRDVLREIPNASVIGNADCGQDAIQKIVELKPDVVTLDVEMPDITGLEVLREIRRRGMKTSVIMLSRLTDAGAQTTTQALLDGAFDFVLKPSGSNPAENRSLLKQALEEKLAAYALHRDGMKSERVVPDLNRSKSLNTIPLEAVLIGASTGGPEALRKVLPLLPATFPVPVFVVQHMPAQYISSLVARLNGLCPLTVEEGAKGAVVEPGKIYVAPGGRHMTVARSDDDKVTIQLNDGPPEHGVRPAVDVLFRSAVSAFESQVLAAILTGMGRDGAQSAALLRQNGARIFVQDAQTSTVFGMPKAAIESSNPDLILPLDQIAEAICRQFR